MSELFAIVSIDKDKNIYLERYENSMLAGSHAVRAGYVFEDNIAFVALRERREFPRFWRKYYVVHYVIEHRGPIFEGLRGDLLVKGGRVITYKPINTINCRCYKEGA